MSDSGVRAKCPGKVLDQAIDFSAKILKRPQRRR
jgi:hypothetical protein